MTILLLGSTGQVGWELARLLAPLGRVVAPARSEADQSRPESLRDMVRATTPLLIVNAAAYTAVDRARSEPELAEAVNAKAPGVLAEEARRLGVSIVHYSTDYVFDGRKVGAYTEADKPAPLNVYGRTKWAGEQAIAASGATHLIFRTSWVYGTRGKNFLVTIRRLAREKESLSVVGDQTGAPTWSRMIAQATALALARHRLPNGAFDLAPVSGLYHLAAAGETTWYGFARAIVAQDEQRENHVLKAVEPTTTEIYGAPEARPANSRLDTGKLASTFGVTLPSWEDSLRQVLEDLR